jgi:hypothetical protein
MRRKGFFGKMSNIRKGDKVVKNDNCYVSETEKGTVFTVRSDPFDICGTVCVLLEGVSGGYALDGLTKVKFDEFDENSLMPCPFCGGEAELIVKDGDYGVCGARIQCKACGCRTKSMSIRDLIITKTSLSTPITENSKKLGIIRAKQAWNQRSNTPAPSEREDGGSKEKQIEEMSFDLCRIDYCKHLSQAECNMTTCAHCEAEAIYNAGYRKVSDILREVIDVLSELHDHFKSVGDIREAFAMLFVIAELKKKYTEEGK